jgi:transposase
MAQHYGVTVIPARPRRPKDKAKVETGVLIMQRGFPPFLEVSHVADARRARWRSGRCLRAG